MGLSPLARGNHGYSVAYSPPFGPIPARAGQPGIPKPVLTRKRAYPRSRGATAIDRLMPKLHTGLSPLARGNLSHLTCCRAREILKMDAKF